MDSNVKSAFTGRLLKWLDKSGITPTVWLLANLIGYPFIFIVTILGTLEVFKWSYKGENHYVWYTVTAIAFCFAAFCSYAVIGKANSFFTKDKDSE